MEGAWKAVQAGTMRLAGSDRMMLVVGEGLILRCCSMGMGMRLGCIEGKAGNDEAG